MRYAIFSLILAIPFLLKAQPFSLEVIPVFSGIKIIPGKTLRSENGDSLTISTLKCYLGKFEFFGNGQVVFADTTYRLLDWEEENPLPLVFDFPKNTAFDSLRFDLGIDSLTHTLGAMSGDLDPVQGMFWTWQSGYINLKLEGFSSKCPVREGLFEFHIGGYLPPFQTMRRVVLPISKTANARLDFDLAPFFQNIDWEKKPGIMSPGALAVQLMDVLAKSFSWHED